MKPTLLVDMDGPLADFERRFFGVCAENGWTLDCTLDTQVHRFSTDHMPHREERRLARKLVDSPGWFRDLPVTPGAAEGLAALDASRETGDIWLCTKPLEANPTCRDEKAAWVAEHLGAEWVKRLIIAPDKSTVRGDILLDDAPYLEWVPRASWVPVIFPAPWNSDGSTYERFDRWAWGDPIDDLLSVAWWCKR